MSKNNKLYKDKIWLKEKYWNNEMSIYDMSLLSNCSTTTIIGWMDKFGISRRSSGDGYKVKFWKNHQKKLSTCAECGKSVSRYAVRCVSCSNKNNIKTRKKRGRVAFYYCEDCDNEVTNKRCKRCWSCECIYRGTLEGRKANSDRQTIESRLQKAKAVKRAHIRGDFDGANINPSKPEIDITTFLKSLNIKHLTQYRPNSLSTKFDFYFPECNVLLEFQGDYWHNLPGAKERDKLKAASAISLGYDVRELWEKDYNNWGILVSLKNRIPELKL